MAEEAQAPETPDTPEPAAPVEDTQQPVVNWEQRYQSLRPEFDRKSQQLAEYEERLAAYEAQQQEPDDDEDYEFEYEDSLARRELAEIKALLAERDEQAETERQHQEATAHIDSELDALEEEFSEEFSDSEAEWIGSRAYALRDEHGKPDVRAAYAAFNDMLEGRKQKWTKTKKAPKVNSGPAAAQSIDLDDPKVRREFLAQSLRDAENQD